MTFKGETLLITGGTGSFGNAVLNRFLKTDIKEKEFICIGICYISVYDIKYVFI